MNYAGVKIKSSHPGHATSARVERVLNMAMAASAVDAVEGPMPQTRTALARALEPVCPDVVVQKIDRTASAARGKERLRISSELAPMPISSSSRYSSPSPQVARHRGDGQASPRPRPLSSICAGCRRPDVDTMARQMLVASLARPPSRRIAIVGRGAQPRRRPLCLGANGEEKGKRSAGHRFDG